ncbi:MAG TPA: hypothetical protein VIH99_04135 [Bdellovibrionota bacterium]|jgi:hypothetical protein
MKRIVAAAFFVLLPIQGFAKEQLKKFRLAPKPGQQSPETIFPDPSLEKPKFQRSLLKGVGEFISREGQMVGKAHVAGTWKQTILNSVGEVTYSAGALMENLPSKLAPGETDLALTEGLESAMRKEAELQAAARIFPPSLEVKKGEAGEWIPYWRVEYLSPKQDELRFLQIGRKGEVIGRGRLNWDGADGRAAVFPKGPKFGGVEEQTLRDLTGDGTVTGRLLHVISALDLKVWSPELTFIFPETDRRFDLGQAYFTIEQGYRWLKEHLGIELDHPIEVKLHVGEGGVSNAAFYHGNTIYLGTGDGETYKDMIRDPSVLIHEGIHAVIDAYAGLPSEGEGGGFNEGFADLFTALILDNPRMGEASYLKGPFRRTLENRLVAYKDFAPGVYQNGSIVAATFWDMKPELGTELTAKLAFRTLVRLGRGAKFDDMPSALAGAAQGLLNEAQTRLALSAARTRGWKVP